MNLILPSVIFIFLVVLSPSVSDAEERVCYDSSREIKIFVSKS